MSDFALPADIPLGPFEGTQINAHAAKGKNARLHADRSCSALRTSDIRSLTLLLNTETIGRMCRQCSGYRQWARPGSALDIFLQAVTGMGLCYELDSYPSLKDDEEWTEREVVGAAALLRQGDSPSEEGEDEDEDSWSEFEKARSTREAVFQQWSSAAESLHRAFTIVGRYPWLEPWARPGLTRKIKYVEAMRGLAARFSRPEALMAATAVFQARDPELPVEDPALSVLGDVATVRFQLQNLWRRWKERAATEWHTPDQHSHLIYDLERGIERRYKKRDAVRARASELVAKWAAQAQATADRQPDHPVQTILARVPKGETHERRIRGNFQESVTHWDLAVLAAYTVEADWGRRAILLRVPAMIGARLLAGGSALDCEPGHDGLPIPSDIQEVDESLSPGVLDDTPVAERRPITMAHLRALRTVDPATEQLVIVFSAENGVEVLPLNAIEKRCAVGWRGVFIAGASDLPATVIEPWAKQFTQDHDAESERLWAGQYLTADDPGFARHLGVAAGEAWLRTMLREPYSSPAERERALRCLALARNVYDLRTLDGDFENRQRVIPVAVWKALLAADALDLRPFFPEDETEFRGGGIGAPLGVLANVQIYSTNADPATMGKGHSPYCSHSREMAVTRYFDLLTVADLLRSDDFDWCSRCGGYAVRRLTDTQLDYYRAAHRLYWITQRLRSGSFQPNTEETATIQSELEALERWHPPDDTNWQGGQQWRWRDIIRDLSARAQQLTSTKLDASTDGNIIRFRKPDEQR